MFLGRNFSNVVWPLEGKVTKKPQKVAENRKSRDKLNHSYYFLIQSYSFISIHKKILVENKQLLFLNINLGAKVGS